MTKNYLKLTALLLGIIFACLPAMADNQDESCEKTTRKGHLYYTYNVCDNYAYIVKRGKSPWYYTDDIVITKVVTITVPTMSTGSGTISGGDYNIPIVEIKDSAFYNATSGKFTFETPSNLRIIRRSGLSHLLNATGTLELPEGLELLEEDAVNAKFTSLIIPSTIDSLSISSVILENVQTIVFLGSTPPRCAVKGDLSPFNNADAATPKDIDVQVPEGSFDAYKYKDGIGDYFTCFGRTSETTGLRETDSNVRKGIYSLTGVYLGEDESVLTRGIYIINGKKVVK